MGELTPDHLIISCHKSQGLIKWEKVGKRRLCSMCSSIHPDEFVERLTKDLKQGWVWSSATKEGSKPRKKPEICLFEGAKFCMDHLRDMPLFWLRLHRRTIAETTGVVFFWKNEVLKWRRITTAYTVKRGYELTEKEREKLERVLILVEEYED